MYWSTAPCSIANTNGSLMRFHVCQVFLKNQFSSSVVMWYIPYLLWLTINLFIGETKRLPPFCYPDPHFVFMLFCIESKETLQNCVKLWVSEVSHHCPGVPIILVGVSHCYRPHFGTDQPPSNRCVSEEEGNEAAKKIGKIIWKCI